MTRKTTKQSGNDSSDCGRCSTLPRRLFTAALLLLVTINLNDKALCSDPVEYRIDRRVNAFALNADGVKQRRLFEVVSNGKLRQLEAGKFILSLTSASSSSFFENADTQFTIKYERSRHGNLVPELPLSFGVFPVPVFGFELPQPSAADVLVKTFPDLGCDVYIVWNSDGDGIGSVKSDILKRSGVLKLRRVTENGVVSKFDSTVHFIVSIEDDSDDMTVKALLDTLSPMEERVLIEVRNRLEKSAN